MNPLEEKDINLNEKREIDLKQILVEIWDNKLILIISLLLCTFIGGQNLSKQEKVYSAKAVFGFKDSTKRSLLPQELSLITNISNSSDKGEIITQINGKNFLREIVIELDLIKKKEFSRLFITTDIIPILSMQNFKDYFKKIIGYKSRKMALSNNEKIEIIVNYLKENNLKISRVKTGGFQVVAKSINPEDAAIIANTVVNKFLEMRLKRRIEKSEKSLDYLSQKLGEAKFKMDDAKNAVEIFALEQNVLSNEEFASQSRRMKEFRGSILKIEGNIKRLNNFTNIIKLNNLSDNEYELLIDELIDISPRIKPQKRYTNTDGIRDLKKEIVFIKEKLPLEITRLKESLKITIEGLAKLEEKAKKTSSEARALQNLESDLNFASARYEALLKEFENQSLIEGFESAVGDVYETALPPIYASSPNPIRTMVFTIILGFAIGFILILIKSALSNKIKRKETFQNIINAEKVIVLSRNVLNFSKLKEYFYRKKKTNYLNDDVFLINSIAHIILGKKQSNHFLDITCVTSDLSGSSLSLALLLSNYFSSNKLSDNMNIYLYDYTKISNKQKLFINKSELKKFSVSNNFINLKDKIFYCNKNQIETNNENQITKNDILINIIEKISTEPENMRKLLNSNFFLLIGESKLTKITDLRRFYDAMNLNMNKCLGYLFIEK